MVEILELCAQFPTGMLRLLLTAFQKGFPDAMATSMSEVSPWRPSPSARLSFDGLEVRGTGGRPATVLTQ